MASIIIIGGGAAGLSAAIAASRTRPGPDILVLEKNDKPGKKILATGNGVVEKAGWSGGYGKMVEIRHAKGVSTRYGHLSAVLVEHSRKGAKAVVDAMLAALGLAVLGSPFMTLPTLAHGDPVIADPVLCMHGIGKNILAKGYDLTVMAHRNRAPVDDLITLRAAAKSLGVVLEEPFLQLAFLALPVIPHLKITDHGMVDVDRFEVLP